MASDVQCLSYLCWTLLWRNVCSDPLSCFYPIVLSLLSCMSSLCTLNIDPLTKYVVWEHFLLFCGFFSLCGLLLLLCRSCSPTRWFCFRGLCLWCQVCPWSPGAFPPCFPLVVLWLQVLSVSLNLSWVNFCEGCKRGIQFCFVFFACEYPVFPTPYTEETLLSPLSTLGCFVKHESTLHVWFYFWALDSVSLAYVSIFMQVPYCFDHYSFLVQFKPGSMMPSALFFFLRIALAPQGLWWFHTNSRIFKFLCKMPLEFL